MMINSQAGLQAGAAPQLHHDRSLRNRIQYHGPPTIDRVDSSILYTCRPCRNGLGLVPGFGLYFCGGRGHGRSWVRDANVWGPLLVDALFCFAEN
jgi:hypothetical protein